MESDKGQRQIWWRFVLASSLGSHRMEEIAWEEFHKVFYSQFFSATVIEEEKIEFMALE